MSHINIQIPHIKTFVSFCLKDVFQMCSLKTQSGTYVKLSNI